ncbi:putative permease [Pontibacter ummariensis]|uniref:Duplicated orphan permease n=1 Tax=Pontibacter ummariensis TaxID=1610492 RepID=A0A239HMD7_9BACT|nr:ABC transporter permease [Pontibacter ummariensis]PRY10337.1 putative permease [Pontibacter ummariensis]SNS82556.1 duplicated orphan permease [Pontibacter ummariensis]
MYKNYLKMAYRNLMRHKVFSLINISGLALGMTCSILILLWVKDEVSMNRFHEDIDNLYRVMEVQSYPGADDLTTDANPGPLAEALEQELPEVKHAVRSTTWEWKQLFAYNDKVLKVGGRYTDPEFFEVFSFPLLHGNAAQVLKQPNSVVISETVAKQFFDSPEAAMGKMFKVDNSKSYKVTGVMQDVPKNSTMQFDYVMPLEDWISTPGGGWLKDWGNNGIRTFLQLQPGTDMAAFNEKIKPIVKQHEKESNIDLFVQPVSDMYLYGEFRNGSQAGSGNIEDVRLFSVVAVFILIIACINFMNLATARSAKRAKEVGVRKAIGASKSALIRQFMTESVLVAFLALFVSVNLAGILLPHFNDLTGKFISIDLTDPLMLLLLFGVALLTGIISGSYPAFFLSSFDPAVVLKGTTKLSKRVSVFRKGLVVFQFMLSGLLIVSTLVVYLQLHYIRTKNIGMDRENLMYLPLEGELQRKYEVVKRELEGIPGIMSVSSSNQNPMMVGNSTGSVEWKGKDPNANILFSMMTVDYDFLETMGITLKEGRDFSKSFGTDTAAFIVNHEAARLMQLQEPVGESLTLWGERKGHIIGVVNNFHSSSMHVATQPLILVLLPEEDNTLLARIAPGKTTEAVAAVEQIIKRHNPAFPFEYHFLDEDFEMMYKSEAIMGQLTKYFAGIAIFISCLGLFGLALFTAEQRTKEIGIRKVLGASITSIVYMLSKDFLKLVLIANLIALPLGWYFMRSWLNDYAERTEMSWWIFAVAFVSTVLIAMLTLSFHAVKTAVTNPVTSLRTE